MSDQDVQREIEENERRARDEQDVGVDEDILRQDDGDGSIIDDLGDAILGRDDSSRQQDVEYGDNEGANRLEPS